MSTGSPPVHVVVVGAGITGLACAHRLLTLDPTIKVTLLEASDRIGGLIRTTPFAGLPAVDEAADAFLLRVPSARDLAHAVGLGDVLTSPAVAQASVWRGRLHPLPESLLLGVPTRLAPLGRSRLLSARGKIRAGLEPLVPRTSIDNDCLGAYMRKRLGNEVHEMLIDPLVGSIYAADTDNFSLRGMPQLSELATEGRSLIISARKRPKPAAHGTETPVFAAPIEGMFTTATLRPSRGTAVAVPAARVASVGVGAKATADVASAADVAKNKASHTSRGWERRTGQLWQERRSQRAEISSMIRIATSFAC